MARALQRWLHDKVTWAWAVSPSAATVTSQVLVRSGRDRRPQTAKWTFLPVRVNSLRSKEDLAEIKWDSTTPEFVDWASATPHTKPLCSVGLPLRVLWTLMSLA